MDKTLEMRPSTPSVRVIDLGWQGSLNPSPLDNNEDESLVDEYLSPAGLKTLTGTDDLQEVTTLQMCVDTRDHTLGNFGEGCFLGTYMPNLRQLKLNNSVILSIRDLGTSLSNLQVLWLARCGLTDLDGIASFYSLKELYLAYNDLREISQVSMLENLEILDLEGNNIDQISELQYLALCSNLTTLTIEGNPVCVQPSPEETTPADYNYRVVIKKTIPQIQYLDDVPADQINPTTPRTQSEDWLMVKDLIKESVGSQMDSSLDLGSALRKENVRPSTSQPGFARRQLTALRPSTAGRTISSLHSGRASLISESPGNDPADDESSDLTHGIGKVICGNPIKALRTRKEKMGLNPMRNLQSQGQKPEPDAVVSSQKDRDDVFGELKAWREKHNEVLKRIRDQRAPQVLTIKHSDEEEEDSLSSGSEDVELEDSWDSQSLIRVTPDSSSPSPRSPASQLGEMSFQDAPLQPSPPITPYPPSSATGNSRLNKGADIRARRLIRSTNQSKNLTPRAMEANAFLADEAFLLTDLDDKNFRIPVLSHVMQGGRTDSGYSSAACIHSRSTVERNSPTFITSHQPVIRSLSKMPERPSPPPIIRPVTSTSILQRLPNRPTLLTASKTSNT
ncbi:PREDICTED: leucine-rich repeat-containing protein 56 [Nanorana parkeri]|uniref:leucine-rich repeat-containing protein 56 n=1 Tax=Nanorana parkeri TaxID=125878 RepID=UPI000854473A|nr:PREDICTED: leucine-rich repeat-containing protein 56 [Nanorana parkeri]